MGCYTAQILVGGCHWSDSDGIRPSHVLYLSENSRPAWVLAPLDILGGNSGETQRRIIWVPTVEHMLEDALLMIAIYILKDERVLELARRAFRRGLGDHMELYDDTTEEDRLALYAACRGITAKYKLILSVFQNSEIHGQLGVLADYPMDLVVCTPKFLRLSSEWTGETHVSGSLA